LPHSSEKEEKEEKEKSNPKLTRFAAALPNAIDKKKPLTHAYLSMIKVDMLSTPFSSADIKKPALQKIHHLFCEDQSYKDLIGDICVALRWDFLRKRKSRNFLSSSRK